MKKFYLIFVLITTGILACNESKTSETSDSKTPTTAAELRAKLKVIDENELVNALEIDLPEGLIMTSANSMGPVYNSQFEGTESMESIVKKFRTMLDAKIGTTFLRVESKNDKFEPWDLREVGTISMHNAIYIYNDGHNALNVKVATNKNRAGVLVYLGKAKIY